MSDVSTPAETAPAAEAAPAEAQVAAASEATPPATPAVEAEPDRTAAKIIELTKGHRAAEARAKAAEEKAARLDALLALAKSDPDKLLAELGTSYKALTDHYAGAEEDTPLAREVADMRKREAARVAAEAAREAEAAMADHVANAASLVKAGGAKLKLCGRKGDRPIAGGLTVAETAVQAAATAWNRDGKPELDAAGLNGYLARALGEIETWLADEQRQLADPAPAVAPAEGDPVPAARAETITRDSISGATRAAPPRTLSAREVAAAWAAESGN